MKVFISWSGDASKAVAGALAQSVQDVFSGVETWISAENIEPGQPWFDELMKALEDSRFAVVCLTERTLRAPWIMFESGAVSAKFGSPKVVPLLLDFAPKSLVDPLARFNATAFSQAGVRKLFGSINSSVGAPLTKVALKASFDTVWPELEAAVKSALEEERKATKPKYDVFLSVPMASFETDAEYKAFRAEAMKVVAALRDRCGLSVFCALEGIKSMAEFDTHGVSARDDMDILHHSGNFVMLYPQKLASSALFEAGFALALRLPCLFFVRKEEDLPYLMQRLPEAFTNVSILDSREWKTYEDIGTRLEKNKDRWFGHRAVAQLLPLKD
jgi:hypothetical protein